MMKVGDRVRSNKYDLEGEIQDIGPCDARGCEESHLTLDPLPEGAGWRSRFYYHTSSFELVTSE